jgi:DNA-binding MarR family transcriptional regulator
MNRDASSEDIDGIFLAMANGIRRTMLETLADGAATVGDLAEQLPVTRGAVSQHLKVLLQAGLVEVRPNGRERVYQLCADGLAQLAAYGRRFGERDASRTNPETTSKNTRINEDPVATALTKWQSDARHIDYSVLALMLYFDQIGQSVFKSTSDAAASVGMSYNDLMVLGALRRVGAPYESTLTELSGMFWISLPGMMKRLARLEALGYLERSRNPKDRRSQHVRLTEKGLATLRDLVANHQPAEYFALLDLPEQDRGALSELLPQLLNNIDRLHAHARPAYVVR